MATKKRVIQDDLLKLRCPRDLREKLQRVASKNRRTVSEEIRQILYAAVA